MVNKAKLTPALERKADTMQVGDVVIHRGKRYRMVACTGEAHSNAHIDNCSSCAPFWGRYLVEETAEEARAAREAKEAEELKAKGTYIPMKVDTGWVAGADLRLSVGLRTEHVIRTSWEHPVHGKMYRRWGIGAIPRGGYGRKVQDGPLVDGPWSYAFGLASIITSDPEMSSGADSRRKREAGTEHDVKPGDRLWIDNVVYEIRFWDHGVKPTTEPSNRVLAHGWIELVPVEVA